MSEENTAVQEPAQQQPTGAGIETPEGVNVQPQNQNGAWFPEKYKGTMVENMPSMEHALDQLLEKEKFISSSHRFPGNDAPPEKLEEFFSKIRPEKPEDYQVDLKIPKEDGEFEPFEPNETQQKIIESHKQLAHKHGISQQQFNGFLNDLLATELQQASQQEQAQIEEMKQSLGNQDSYNKHIAMGNLVYKNLPEDVQQAVSQIPIKERYAVLNHIAAQSGEDQTPKNAQQASGDLQDIEKKIGELNKTLLESTPNEKLAIRRELNELYTKKAQIRSK